MEQITTKKQNGGARKGSGRKKLNHSLLRAKIDTAFLEKVKDAAKSEELTIGEWLCEHVIF